MRCSYPRKPSERDRCVVRLKRLHPEITKSKIRAALTLCDGDTLESVRLLNACLNKMHLKTLSSPSCNPIKISDDVDILPPSAMYLQADINQNSITIYNTSIEQDPQLPPLGSFPNCSGTTAISTICSISDSSILSDKRSTLTANSLDTEDSSVDGLYHLTLSVLIILHCILFISLHTINQNDVYSL